MTYTEVEHPVTGRRAYKCAYCGELWRWPEEAYECGKADAKEAKDAAGASREEELAGVAEDLEAWANQRAAAELRSAARQIEERGGRGASGVALLLRRRASELAGRAEATR